MYWKRRISVVVLTGVALGLLGLPAANAGAAVSHQFPAASQLAGKSHATLDITPSGTHPVNECGPDSAAVFRIAGLLCLAVGTTTDTSAFPEIQNFANVTPYRVWFHQNSSGSGWAYCFNPNSTWSIRGNAEHPGNIQVTTTPQLCTANPPNDNKGRCGEFIDANTASYLDALGPDYNSANACFPDKVNVTYTKPWSNLTWLAYNSAFRVWLHQNPNGSGWAYCISDGIWLIGASGATTPGNIQFTDNTSPCPAVSGDAPSNRPG
jgi:hypothetical protein